ncbi:MAG: polyphosphate kinase 1 [Flavobacteriales bacterium]|nr:polyphosphate kinase 1 [Flavobacteriales bacterium]
MIKQVEKVKESLSQIRSSVKKAELDLVERDLSWLKFNQRVLMEAQDPSVPIFERVKFMAIYSSNMDEFFRVRFANMRRMSRLAKYGKKKIRRKAGFITPQKLINETLAMTWRQQEDYGRTYRETILPDLEKAGVILQTTEAFHPEHREVIEDYFYSQILSFISPTIPAQAGSRPLFLKNRRLYHAVDLVDSEGNTQIGIVNVPSEKLQRFYELPPIDGKYHFAFIDDIVRAFMHILFPKYRINGIYEIKLNRDAELYLEDEISGTLIEKIKKNLTKRDIGIPSRFLYDKTMPEHMVKDLQRMLDLSDNDLVPGGRYHNMFDHFQLPNPLGKEYEYPKDRPIAHPLIEEAGSVLEAMEQDDIMLHFPYQRTDYILRYFNEAVISEKIKEIKVTLYRVAENSHVVNALISAARNGKKVTAFVEAKARFDEENNLKWAHKMMEEGIDVRFSSLNLKVHAKVALLNGVDDEGNPKRYAFFGTGNFNEKTAMVYADHAYLTCNDTLTEELDRTMEFIFGNVTELKVDHLFVAQVNMIQEFERLIKREIDHVKAGKKGRMVIKLNNLQDPYIISKIYEAADAGVEVDIIVRAICCAVPRPNLRLIRIVDKYLEHARVYWFHNDGEDELYMGSADWMERNLYRRIEVVFPLHHEGSKKEIEKCLELQLNDNTKACLIRADMSNDPIQDERTPCRAQTDFYAWLKEYHNQ